MKVLVNLSTLKGGGGQNVAMNFLHGLQDAGLDPGRFHFLVARGSQPHRYLSEKGSGNFHVAPAHPVKRMLFELFRGGRILAEQGIDVIYTYFGYGLFRGKVPQVCGSADSNLYYPEIDFWSGHSPLGRLKRALVDRYRIMGIKRADAVVFENQDMQKRSERIFGLKETAFIKPSVNFDFKQSPYALPAGIPAGAGKALFLCGWQLNKQVMLIPDLAAEAKRTGLSLHFILTAPPDGSAWHNAFTDKAASLGVGHMISVTGPVRKDELAGLYGQVDCVLLLSKLESFSNNIIEAWYFKRPLLAASEAWSRSICGDAALYVDRDSPAAIVEGIRKVLREPGTAADLAGKGERMLAEYPTIGQRIEQEMGYLEYVSRRA